MVEVGNREEHLGRHVGVWIFSLERVCNEQFGDCLEIVTARL